MTIPMAGSRPPLQPGETAPDFSLPLVTRAKLEALGIEGVGITEDRAEPVGSYYRMRPSKLRLATDPKRDVHRRYGLPMPFYGRLHAAPGGHAHQSNRRAAGADADTGGGEESGGEGGASRGSPRGG